MSSLRTRLVPPLVASLALFVHVGLMYTAALRHTGGVISYPVDDAFIHLALAKQIALGSVYGVVPDEFAAASSSIGWPLILAFAIKLAGAKAWLPLALNSLFAVALFFAVDRAVLRIAPAASTVSRTAICLVVMLLTPMATLVVLGMEHTAHAAVNIAFITSAVVWLVEAEAPDAKTSLRRALTIAAWAGATTLWRYEGMFPVAFVVMLSLARRRVRPAVLIALGGALPVVLFGIYSKAHGAHFLPTPVLLKGRHFDLKDVSAYFDLLGGDLLDRFGTEAYALSLAVAAAGLAFYLVRRDGFWSPNVLALLITLGTVILHLELASVGWFFRYESYFIAMGVTFLGATLARLLPPPRELWRVARTERVRVIAATVGVLILSAPLWRRSISANNNTPMACRNIYEQQLQTARFLATRFPNKRVAVNDIGAVAWLDNGKVVDLVGLATLPIAEAKHLKIDTPMSREDFVRLTEGVEVAVVYDEWFSDNLPSTWLRVARWTIRDNKSCAFPTVAVYATNPERYPEILEAVRAFEQELPERVLVEGRASDRPFDRDHWRTGDRLLVDTSLPEVSGAYPIEGNGTVVLPGIGPVVVRGLTAENATAELQKRIDVIPSKIRGTKIVRVTRVALRTPSVLVAGALRAPGEVPASPLDLDATLRAMALGGTSDPSRAWLWREDPTAKGGFVKMARAELAGGALLDGDIVVVP
jgi:hypothetical protein